MLVLVVGPSGAGKDTVLGLARHALRHDRRFRFVRRVITRPADPQNEDHEPVSDADFATRRLALQWQAHGFRYGIPADISHDIARGIVVIANVSRSVIAEAAAKHPVQVIEITAPSDILAQRLASRGRETASDIKQRLSRDVPIPGHVSLVRIVNDGAPHQAAARFGAALIRAAESVPQL